MNPDETPFLFDMHVMVRLTCVFQLQMASATAAFSVESTPSAWETAQKALEKLQAGKSGDGKQKESDETAGSSNNANSSGVNRDQQAELKYPPGPYPFYPPLMFGGPYRGARPPPPGFPYGPFPPGISGAFSQGRFGPPPGMPPYGHDGRPPPLFPPYSPHCGEEEGGPDMEDYPDGEENHHGGPQSPYPGPHQYPPGLPSHFSFQGRQSRWGEKQAPGTGGIRFDLPKRNNLRPGNAMQNVRQRYPQPQRPPFAPERPYPQNEPGNRQQKQNQAPDSSQNHRSTSFENVKSEDTAKMVANSSTEEKDAMLTTGADSASASGEWPLPLKLYVQRCFSSVRNDCDKDHMEKLLRQVLTDAFNTGTSNTKEWSKEPVPILPSASLQNNSPSKASRWDGAAANRRGPLAGFRSFGQSCALRYSGRSRSRSRSSSRSRGRSKSPRRRRSRSRSRSPRYRRRRYSR